MSVLARAVRQISRINCSRRCAMNSADTWKSLPNEEKAMNVSHSDALVFFGATGDLAYKKIFPALQAMAKRGHLDVPVIGVAKARSEEHTSELQSRPHLVCRLLLE